MRYKDSKAVVEETRYKFTNTNENFKFEFDLSYLDAKLKEMLYLEKKISWTKKTVSKNSLIKKLNIMHSKADSYVYNSSKHGLFDYMLEQVERETWKAIENTLSNFAPVRTITDPFSDYYFQNETYDIRKEYIDKIEEVENELKYLERGYMTSSLEYSFAQHELKRLRKEMLNLGRA